jgi:hypothetical protein
MVLGELFDGFHILYIVISLAITVVVLYLATKFLKKQNHKDLFLVIVGCLCFITHISSLWYEFLTNYGQALAPDYMLFPVYFCNLQMGILLFLSILKNKQSRFYQTVSIFAFWGGLFGATVSLFDPDYYLGASNLNWGIWKSMLSHSIMFIGTTWLLLGGYFKPRFSNVIWYVGGIVITGVLGYFTNVLFDVFINRQINAMWMQAPAIDGTPFTGWVLAPLTIIVVGVVSILFELKLPKEIQIFTTKKLEWL